MYYLQMKTLVRTHAKLSIAISGNETYKQANSEVPHYQYRKSLKNLKILLMALSFFTFLFISESPETNASICQRYNPSMTCNIW